MPLLLLLALACPAAPPQADVSPWADATCDALFGQPGPNTGLDEAACRPELVRGDQTWSPALPDAEGLAALRAWTLRDPSPVPARDPYLDPDPAPPGPEEVCALHVVDEDARTYRLRSHASQAAALAEGGRVTHGGPCGLCSSLADLAVYIERPDLATPVRQCGLEGMGGEALDAVPCLMDLGFTEPCATIWAWNIANTREACFDTCLSLLTAPYHEPDGALNDCIQCDEDVSGPVFKAVAGRTRRGSGLPTALCRPCETIWRVDHEGPM